MNAQNFMRYFTLLCLICLTWFACEVGSPPCYSDNDCGPLSTCVYGKCFPKKRKEKTPDASLPPEKQGNEILTAEANQPDDRSCKSGETKPCGSKEGECKQGRQTCEKGKWSECKGAKGPTKELCNEKDDNCDGKIDEPFSTKGTPCKVGVGECQSSGKWTCLGGELKCNASEKTPKKEECDGKDNDCNGKVDELPECKKRHGRFVFSSGGTKASTSKYKLRGLISPALLVGGHEMSSGKYKLKAGFLPGTKP